jgi:predicted metal-dependent phosphotriesterase family hydrolase
MLGALRRGANVSVDMISYEFLTDQQRIDVARTAIEAGFVRQVMVSHDALVVQNGPETLFGIGPSDFGYIPRVFVPKLQAATGISDAEVSIILEGNPQRFLAM